MSVDQELLVSQQLDLKQKQAKTVLLDSMGEPFERFWDDFVTYLTTDLSKEKSLVIGGGTGVRKTQWVMEVLTRLQTDPTLDNCQKEHKFKYFPDYLNTGMVLQAGRNIGVVRSKQGLMGKIEYRSASENEVRIRRLSTELEPYRNAKGRTKIIEIAESVLLTGLITNNELGYEIEDVDRGLDYAVQAYQKGGFIVLADAPLEAVEKKLRVVKRVRQAELSQIPTIMVEEGIDDNRTPEEIKEAYTKTGDEETRLQQDRDINSLMSKLIFENRLPWPFSFENIRPINFRYNPKERVEFMRNYYIPYWAWSFAGEEMQSYRELPERIYFLTSDDLPPDSDLKAYGQKLNEANVITKINDITRKPGLEHLRRIAQAYGVIP